MKNIVILILFLGFGMTAQNDRHEKIKALKTAFITEQLNLTPSEAQKFWPIYNEHEEKMGALRQIERKEVFKRIKDGLDEISDTEANQLIEKVLDVKTKELNYDKELVKNLRGVVPPKKIIILKKAEEDFKRKLLDRYKNKKN